MNDLKRTRPLKWLGLIAALLLLFFIIVWVRVLYSSWENYQRAETLLKDGNTVRAITYLDRSIHWYTPWSPYVQKSAERLWEIGERAQKDHDEKLALIAFDTIRSGFYGASHWVTPGKDWIDRVDSKLQELGAAGDKVRDPRPNVLWSVVLLVGFFGWIGSLFGLVLNGAGKGRDSKRPSIRTLWAGLAGIFFVLWILGMLKA